MAHLRQLLSPAACSPSPAGSFRVSGKSLQSQYGSFQKQAPPLNGPSIVGAPNLREQATLFSHNPGAKTREVRNLILPKTCTELKSSKRFRSSSSVRLQGLSVTFAASTPEDRRWDSSSVLPLWPQSTGVFAEARILSH